MHCSATPVEMDIGVEQIDVWHRKRGFNKVGYHYVIRRDGKLEQGRQVMEQGAHCYGKNDVSVGICLIGGIDDRRLAQANYTEQQYAELYELLKCLTKIFPDAEVRGHCDFDDKKACPCFDVNWWFKCRKEQDS